MKLSKAKRREIYLEVATGCGIEAYPIFLCNAISRVCRTYPTPETFPELFLFRETPVWRAWLSWQINEDGKVSDGHANAIKETVILLCAEMCNP